MNKEQHKGWINLYRHNYHHVISVVHADRWVYDTQEKAVNEGKKHSDYIATIEAVWEE